MKTSKVIIGILFLLALNGCDSNDALGENYSPLNFDKTELTVDSQINNVEFICEKKWWNISFITEIIGSDTTSYFTKVNDLEFVGNWYNAKISDNILKVEVFENLSNKKRQLILEIIKFGYVGNTIKVIQNSN